MLIFYSFNLALCLHLAIHSHLLFHNFSGSEYSRMWIFSSKHRLHLHTHTHTHTRTHIYIIQTQLKLHTQNISRIHVSLIGSVIYSQNPKEIRMHLVLFNPSIGLYQVLPFQTRVNPGAMAMKWCFVFPKVPASLEPHHQIV